MPIYIYGHLLSMSSTFLSTRDAEVNKTWSVALGILQSNGDSDVKIGIYSSI